jgi:bifunctional DNase/RNase
MVKILHYPIIILLLILPFVLILDGCATNRIITFEGKPMTEVKVRDVRVDTESMVPVVILEDVAQHTFLPIWIGSNEALAIVSPIQDLTYFRPLTHDLLENILGELKASVTKVIITEIRGNTFYAVILLKSRGRDLVIDSRPSDAIALAVRVDAPIFVSTDLLLKRGIKKGSRYL